MSGRDESHQRWTSTDAALLEPFLTPRRLRRIEEILDERTRTLTVVLEDVHDPHNAAAVLRSCDAFGVQDVHVVAGPVAGGSFRPSKRVSKGTARWLTLHWWPDPASCVRALRARGLRVAVSDLQGGMPLDDLDLTRPTALVFGNEHAGVSDAMRDLADVRFFVPMHGFVQSLNISVAAAICLHEAAPSATSRRPTARRCAPASSARASPTPTPCSTASAPDPVALPPAQRHTEPHSPNAQARVRVDRSAAPRPRRPRHPPSRQPRSHERIISPSHPKSAGLPGSRPSIRANLRRRLHRSGARRIASVPPPASPRLLASSPLTTPVEFRQPTRWGSLSDLGRRTTQPSRRPRHRSGLSRVRFATFRRTATRARCLRVHPAGDRAPWLRHREAHRAGGLAQLPRRVSATTNSSSVKNRTEGLHPAPGDLRSTRMCLAPTSLEFCGLSLRAREDASGCKDAAGRVPPSYPPVRREERTKGDDAPGPFPPPAGKRSTRLQTRHALAPLCAPATFSRATKILEAEAHPHTSCTLPHRESVLRPAGRTPGSEPLEEWLLLRPPLRCCGRLCSVAGSSTYPWVRARAGSVAATPSRRASLPSQRSHRLARLQTGPCGPSPTGP